MNDPCKFKGPYYPVGDIDWVCLTHDTLLYRANPDQEMSKKNAWCPESGEPKPAWVTGDEPGWEVVT